MRKRFLLEILHPEYAEPWQCPKYTYLKAKKGEISHLVQTTCIHST